MEKQEQMLQLDRTKHKKLINPILTDNYQLTMAYAYFQANRHLEEAVFEVFFRKCPFKGQYAIYAGLKEALSFIQYYKFTEDQITYIKQILPVDANPKFFDWLKSVNTNDVQIFSLREGEICFPSIPVMKLVGPIAVVQMLETSILNLLSFPTLVATNASRMRKAAGNDKVLLEFGLRRAQGPDGGLSASQYSFLGGFNGTSNLLAGMMYDIPVSGTMAHSFVTSFESLNQIEEFEINGIKIKETALQYRQKLNFMKSSENELAAFLHFAFCFKQNFVCLVDTYDTLCSGVPNFICVAFAMMDANLQPKGIRLDSGDLAKLSISSKDILKKCGQEMNKDISKILVVASNDINEDSLIEMNKKCHQIDVFGIGTNLVTCQKQPALGMVYKLCEIKGKPVHKLSEEVEKITLPGKKNAFRLFVHNKKHPVADLIAMEGEVIWPEKEIRAVRLQNPLDKYIIRAEKVVNLLENWFNNGIIPQEVPNIQEAKKYCAQQMEIHESQVTQINDPKKYLVLVTESYFRYFQEACDKINIPTLLE